MYKTPWVINFGHFKFIVYIAEYVLHHNLSFWLVATRFSFVLWDLTKVWLVMYKGREPCSPAFHSTTIMAPVILLTEHVMQDYTLFTFSSDVVVVLSSCLYTLYITMTLFGFVMVTCYWPALLFNNSIIAQQILVNNICCTGW